MLWHMAALVWGVSVMVYFESIGGLHFGNAAYALRMI